MPGFQATLGLNLCMLGNFSCSLLSSTSLLFSKFTFLRNSFRTNIRDSECQKVWIQMKIEILSVLIRAQTVCKDYQQTTKFLFEQKLPLAWKRDLILLIFYVQKISSAFYVCCIYSNAIQTSFITEAKTMNLDKTAPNIGNQVHVIICR